jgi:4-hydroxy-tetrahydrodipicolinate synthase
VSETGSPRLRGAITALVTPFDLSGRIDVAALERLVRFQVTSGIHGLCPCGTTGEGATLDEDEKARVVTAVVRATAGRVPVIAGCGTNDTRTTVAAARAVERAGADGLLVVSPYYNKPNTSGLVAHYEAVARATDLPVIVYNVPGRTGQNLGAETILRLAEIPGIVGVKEASGDLEQMATILARRPDGFAVLSGEDGLALPAIALGAEGLVSVVSNEAPAETAALVEHALAGELSAARRLHFRLLPLMRANFRETNPVPVKAALERLGACEATLRPPLGPAAEATIREIDEALAHAAIRRIDG